MRAKWAAGKVYIEMTVDEARSLLTWLQKIGTMMPGSVQESLRSRLSESYERWSKP